MFVMRKGASALILITVGSLSALVAPCSSGERRVQPLSVADALDLRAFAELMPIGFSPDGRWLSYTVKDSQRRKLYDFGKLARGGIPPWAVEDDLYILNVTTGKSRNLTDGRGDNWFPTWSPNGHFLAFLSDRDSPGSARLWIWDVEKDQLRNVSDTEVRTDQIEWTHDSQRILVTTPPPRKSIEAGTRRDSSPVEEQEPATDKASNPTVILYHASATSTVDEEVPQSDPWSLDGKLRELTLVEIRSGEATPIVRGKRITAYSLSPDGSNLAYTIPERFEKPGSQQILYGLSVIGTTGDHDRLLASNIRLGFDGASFSWSPDSSQIAYQTGGMEEPTNDCFVVDLKGGIPRNVSLLSPPEQVNSI